MDRDREITVLEQPANTVPWRSAALRHAPVIRCDDLEPFSPQAVGYSVHERDGPSASSAHPVRLGGAARAIEYAIWWDWDIQHLCEMEHVWVYLSENDQPIRVESSTQGCVGEVWREGQRLPLKSGRVTLFSEPGKHAFAANPERLCTNYSAISRCCGDGAGANGVRVPELLGGMLNELTIYDRHLVRSYLKSQSFMPTFRFDKVFDLRNVPIMPWDELGASIPGRVRAVLASLRAEAKGVKAILLDSGDTLIDENSQVFIEGELVLQADPIPGGDRLVAELRRRGYLVALVADGLVKSFENVHKALGFWDHFDAYAISETVGAFKPDRRIFEAATLALGLTEDDYPGCVMVGNNLERDIAGANRLGMRSVWISWSSNYPTEPANEDQRPDFEIKLPHELFDVLDEINASD